MSIFSTGEEVICVDATNAFGFLQQGKTYIVLGHCKEGCCVDLGYIFGFYESRFRRPSHDSITTSTKVPERV